MSTNYNYLGDVQDLLGYGVSWLLCSLLASRGTRRSKGKKWVITQCAKIIRGPLGTRNNYLRVMIHVPLRIISKIFDLQEATHVMFADTDVEIRSKVQRTPQQNGVVKRQNRTLLEAARTMLIFSKAPMFLWAEAVATTCYTQTDPLFTLVITKPHMSWCMIRSLNLASQGKGYENPTIKGPTNHMQTIHVQTSMSYLSDGAFPINSVDTPSSTTIDQDAPSPSHSPSSSALQSPSSHQGVAAGSTIIKDNHFAPIDNNPFVNVFSSEPSSEASSSDNIISNPSRPVSTSKQLATDALWCLYNSVLSKVEPKDFKYVITEDCWFQAMQDEIHEFNQL
ncbi:retrovirus-related pol polyprotein from transposon TNT 1-94 [Tanacetum coccineum]